MDPVPRAVLPLALVACLLVAGCATGGSPTPTSGAPGTDPGSTTTDGTTTTAERTTTTTSTTTHQTTTSNCPPPGNLSTRALPDRPANLSRESVKAFVAAYEEATTWNRQLDAETISMGVHVSRVSVLNETATGYVLHVEGGFGFETCLDGAHVAGDGYLSANYFVNETTVIRLNLPPERTTDPRGNGTVVERWAK